jgi:hypothetical protein
LFDGTAKLDIENIPAVVTAGTGSVADATSFFAIAMVVAQDNGTSGYLFGRHDATNSRIFTLFSSNTDLHSELLLVLTHGPSGRLITARYVLDADHRLDDGEQHKVMLSIDDAHATVRVDDASPNTQRIPEAAAIDECDPTDSDDNAGGAGESSCIFSVGGAGVAGFEFAGTIFGAWLFASSALDAFPDSLAAAAGAINEPVLISSATTAPPTTTDTSTVAATTTSSTGCGAGSFVLPSTGRCVACPAGYSDHDSDPATPCERCRSGQHTVQRSVGRCSTHLCPAGSTDADSDAATGCEQCEPGTFVPAGKAGGCPTFACPVGSADHDRDPATRCVTCAFAGNGLYVGSGTAGGCDEQKCAAGTVDHDGDMTTVCRECNGATEYQSAAGQTRCVQTSACEPGQEQTRPPTPWADRECTACEVGVTFSSDPFDEAGCRPCTPPCAEAGLSEVVAPTATSDRVCGTTTTVTSTSSTTTVHTLCEFTVIQGRFAFIVGRYQAAAPTPSSDRVCLAITTCAVGAEYEVAAPIVGPSGYPAAANQPTHVMVDRSCAPLTDCKASEFESVAAEYNRDRSCAPIRAACPYPVEYESAAPSATSDRLCGAVRGPCVVGQYEAVVPSPSAQRVCVTCQRGTIDHDSDPATPCVLCPGGTFQDTAGATRCRDSTLVCPVGTSQSQAANRTHPLVCSPCNGVTNYQSLAGQSECAAISSCPAGTIVVADPTPSSDRDCTACDGVTTYQPVAMQRLCLPVRPPCGYGFRQLAPPTATADRQCVACESGVEYQDELDQPTCKPVSVCDAGTVEFRPPTRFADRACVPCNGITEYQDQPGERTCKPVASCDLETEFVQLEATPSSDRQWSVPLLCAHFVLTACGRGGVFAKCFGCQVFLVAKGLVGTCALVGSSSLFVCSELKVCSCPRVGRCPS